MKTKWIVLIMLAAGVVFAQVSVGVRIGPPPQGHERRAQPPSPGPGYSWVAGYMYPVDGRYRWHDGYWTRPAYTGARWVAPHHDGERYFDGYWDGDRGHVVHDHSWDRNRDHNRDFNRDHDRDHDRQ